MDSLSRVCIGFQVRSPALALGGLPHTEGWQLGQGRSEETPCSPCSACSPSRLCCRCTRNPAPTSLPGKVRENRGLPSLPLSLQLLLSPQAAHDEPGFPSAPALSPPVCLCSADPQALCHPTSAGLVPVSQGPAAEAPAQPLPGSPASRSHCSLAQQAGNRGRGVRVMLLPLPRALTHAVLPVPVEPPPRGAGALEAALGVDAALVAAAVAHAALVHVCSTGGGGGRG